MARYVAQTDVLDTSESPHANTWRRKPGSDVGDAEQPMAPDAQQTAPRAVRVEPWVCMPARLVAFVDGPARQNAISVHQRPARQCLGASHPARYKLDGCLQQRGHLRCGRIRRQPAKSLFTPECCGDGAQHQVLDGRRETRVLRNLAACDRTDGRAKNSAPVVACRSKVGGVEHVRGGNDVAAVLEREGEHVVSKGGVGPCQS